MSRKPKRKRQSQKIIRREYKGEAGSQAQDPPADKITVHPKAFGPASESRTVHDIQFDWWDTVAGETRTVYVKGCDSLEAGYAELEKQALDRGWTKPNWLTHLWRDTVEEAARVVTRTETDNRKEP